MAPCRSVFECSDLYMLWPLHTGTLNALLKQKGQTTSEGPAWSLSGNQGDLWKQAKVSIHPTASFQVRPQKCNQYNEQQHSGFTLM